jgi:hypothetical protein
VAKRARDLKDCALPSPMIDPAEHLAAGEELLLLSVTGSTAYGLATDRATLTDSGSTTLAPKRFLA